MAADPRTRVLRAFEQRFGSAPRWLVRAPGRVNLLGAHVDYVEGWVLPGAIDRAVWLAARPTGGRAGVIAALDLGESGDLDVADLPPPVARRPGVSGSWLDLPRGVAWELSRRGEAPPSLDAVFGSDLPIGAGLSSSAAVEVAFAMAWEAASGNELTGLERAQLGRAVENVYLGVGSGIMDQFASIHGRADHLLLLDCRTLAHEEVRLPAGLAVLIADSGIRRTLAGSDYNDRPAECREAADLLRKRLPHVRTLRDVSPVDLEEFGDSLPARLLLRARHAVAECRRVRDGARALRDGDVGRFGALMRASHESSRDLYQVSILELDLLAETAWSAEGCLGARLSGAGFGGCVTAVVEAHELETVAAALRGAYAEQFGRECPVYAATIADGARLEDL